jgi:hypothetical protein
MGHMLPAQRRAREGTLDGVQFDPEPKGLQTSSHCLNPAGTGGAERRHCFQEGWVVVAEEVSENM